MLEERGIDTAPLRSKGIDEYLGRVHFQYLITVCAIAEAHCPRIWPGASNHLHWPVENPALVTGEGRLEAFRAACDEIARRILELLDEVPDAGAR